MLQVSSGVKPGQHRSPAEGAEQMRQKITLDILFPTFPFQTPKASELQPKLYLQSWKSLYPEHTPGQLNHNLYGSRHRYF